MRYTTLLLDADGTLLDFERAEDCALRETFGKFGLRYDDEIRAMYKTLNRKLWEAFEKGEISREQILRRRFRNVFHQMGVKEELAGFEEEYQLALGRGAFVMPNAPEVCRRLCGPCRLYVVTNGVAATQRSHLERSGLLPYLSGVFISEEMGYRKPQKEYFDHAFSRIPDFDRESTLMVGDSLTSDMRGGVNAGLSTCWYNPQRKPNFAGVRIDHEIHSLEELCAVAAGGEALPQADGL